ncbi:MAG: ADP-ribose pyrophosphatase [Verrucomicrobia bacterium]|jgi:8-oxo-dGTP pyrophosphatase MutT (NUDIX family)|nr:MAG: ADP-ribose pyrophosphatase [Verrucomicrobiota bacterium]
MIGGEPFRVEDGEGWERVEEATLFDHRWIRVEQATFRTRNRSGEVTWVVSRRPAGAVVAPQLPDGSFLMIRQERYPVQRVLWEFPAGLIDDPRFREDFSVIEAAALRELEEETGHRLLPEGRLVSLGHYFSSVGFTDEHCYLFLAQGVGPTGEGLRLDGGENILEVRAFPVTEIREMIRRNELVDANSLVVFARLCALGFIA